MGSDLTWLDDKKKLKENEYRENLSSSVLAINDFDATKRFLNAFVCWAVKLIICLKINPPSDKVFERLFIFVNINKRLKSQASFCLH